MPGYTKVAEPHEPPRRRNLAQQVLRVATQMDETAQKEGTHCAERGHPKDEHPHD